MSAPRIGPDARSQSSGGPACRKVPALEPERLGGRTHVDERRPSRGVIRSSAVRWPSTRRGSPMTRARSPRCPPSAAAMVSVTRHRLVAQRVGEQGHPGGRHDRVGLEQAVQRPVARVDARHRALPARSSAVPGGGGVGQEHRRRRRRRALRHCASRPCGSPSVPVSDTTTAGPGRRRGRSREPRTASASSAAGSGWAP